TTVCRLAPMLFVSQADNVAKPLNQADGSFNQLLLPKRLGKHGNASETMRERLSAITGNKYEGDSPPCQGRSNIVYWLAMQVAIQQRRIQPPALNDIQRFLRGTRAGDDLGACRLETIHDVKGDERLVLHHQETPCGQLARRFPGSGHRLNCARAAHH